MTLLAEPTTRPAGPPATAGGPSDRSRMVNQLVGSMSTVVAIMLLVFVAEMVVVGPVRHARAQSVLYQQFRSELADAVAPTGQLDANGKPVAPGAPVAIMAIPKIGLKEVVAEGTTAQVLMSGPGHLRDTPLPGQAGTVVVFGRQATYGGPFARIAELKAGDQIAFATGQGDELYKVTGIRHAGDLAPAADPTAARLTLVTASGTPYLAQEVVRVDAALTTAKQPAPARQFGPESLAPSESVMAGDSSAWLPLLLWSQLLLLVAVAGAWLLTVWGRWQCWIVGLPVLTVVGFAVARQVAQLLPNLL